MLLAKFRREKVSPRCSETFCFVGQLSMIGIWAPSTCFALDATFCFDRSSLLWTSQDDLLLTSPLNSIQILVSGFIVSGLAIGKGTRQSLDNKDPSITVV